MRANILLAAALLHLATHAQLTNGCFTIGGPEYELARAVVQTTDGGYAFAGLTYSFSSGPTVECMYVVKTDAYSAVLWNMGYEATASIIGVAYDMIQTNDGGYAICGVSEDIIMGLMKLDANGAVVWSKQYDTSPDGVDDLYAVVQTPDGGYLLAGSGGAAGSLQTIAVVIKTDANGTIEWSKGYESGFALDETYDVVVVPAGGYAMCGWHTGGTVPGMRVWRLDDLGAVLWAKSYGAGFEIAHAIAATPDSGFVVAGRTRTYGFSSVADLQDDGFVVKLDQDGLLEWGRAYGDSTLSEEFLGVVPTSDGGYAMAGQAAVPPLGVGAPRIYVAKCDANGDLLWSQKLNAVTHTGIAYDIIECTDGGLALIAGLGPGNVEVSFMKMEADGTICPACGPEPYGSDSVAVLTPVDLAYTVYDSVATSADYTATVFPGGVATIGCLETGIAEGAATGSVLMISPNPATDHCIVSLGNATGIETLEVVSSQGTVTKYIPVNDQRQVELSMAGFAQGVYLIRAIGSRQQQQARLMITR